jgi:hypothetical protein
MHSGTHFSPMESVAGLPFNVYAVLGRGTSKHWGYFLILIKCSPPPPLFLPFLPSLHLLSPLSLTNFLSSLPQSSQLLCNPLSRVCGLHVDLVLVWSGVKARSVNQHGLNCPGWESESPGKPLIPRQSMHHRQGRLQTLLPLCCIMRTTAWRCPKPFPQSPPGRRDRLLTVHRRGARLTPWGRLLFLKL